MTKIGTSVGNLTELLGLAIPVEEFDIVPRPYQESVIAGDGTKKGLGFPSQTWTRNGITNDERAQLRVYCPSESAAVFIETTDPEDDTATVIYSAIMHWPDEEDPQINKRLGFVLTFTNLIEQT